MSNVLRKDGGSVSMPRSRAGTTVNQGSDKREGKPVGMRGGMAFDGLDTAPTRIRRIRTLAIAVRVQATIFSCQGFGIVLSVFIVFPAVFFALIV